MYSLYNYTKSTLLRILLFTNYAIVFAGILPAPVNSVEITDYSFTSKESPSSHANRKNYK